MTTTHSVSTNFSKWLAWGLLLLLVLVLIGTFFLDSSLFWVRMIQSSAEAGIIGGLVDLFAVTAIFRHPLRIPIPYTGLVPKSKGKFADGTYNFIIENFSDPRRASRYVEDRRPSKRFSEWLMRTKNAEFAAHIVVTAIPPLLTPKSDRRIRSFLVGTIVEELKKQNILPVFGGILENLYQQHHHQRIVDVAIDFGKEYIENNRGFIREKVSEKSPWYSFGLLDGDIADTIESSLLEKLEELRDWNHPARRDIDRHVERIIEDLKQGRFHATTIRKFWRIFVKSEEASELIAEAWNYTRSELVGDGGVDNWKLKIKLANLFQRLGTLLNEDPELLKEIDARLSDLAGKIAPDVVDGAANYVREEIKRWSGEKVAEKLESAVGKELQYIRINGTVLGCFVGFLLFWVVDTVK